MKYQLAVLSLVVLVATGCGAAGTAPNNPPPNNPPPNNAPADTAGPPVRLDVVSGASQSGYEGTTLDTTLVVRLTDAEGHGSAGQLITWAVQDG
ncbi:MAG TPA: hypothetical protein VFW98_17980, partial [Gemmatimonadaceae bacterium]|nr:hypothetical protein [Gemmatimonadaceae bacterium]